MSIAFTLILETDKSHQQILQMLLASPALQGQIRRNEAESVITITTDEWGVWIRTGDNRPVPSKYFQEVYGFKGTVYVVYKPRKDLNIDLADRNMRVAILDLLTRENGNAALDFEGEWIILLRKDSQIFLGEGRWDWCEDLLSLVPMPYTMKRFNPELSAEELEE